MFMDLMEERDTAFYVLASCLSKNEKIRKHDGTIWGSKKDAFTGLLNLYNERLFDRNDDEVTIVVWECIDKNNPDAGNEVVKHYNIEDVITYFETQNQNAYAH